MLPLIVVSLIGVTMIGLILIVVRAHKRAQEREEEELVGLGFVACPEEQQQLTELVTFVENNREYTFSVADARRLFVKNRPVYVFRRTRRGGGNTTVTREVLFPLLRPTGDGLLLNITPGYVAASGLMKRAADIALGPRDVHPDDLARLDVPENLSARGLFGALGPAGAHLPELAEPDVFNLLMQAGECGAFTVHCRGEWCCFSCPTSGTPLKASALMAIVRELLGGATG